MEKDVTVDARYSRLGHGADTRPGTTVHTRHKTLLALALIYHAGGLGVMALALTYSRYSTSVAMRQRIAWGGGVPKLRGDLEFMCVGRAPE